MSTMNHIARMSLIAMGLAAGCVAQDDGIEIGPRGGLVVSQDGRFALDIPKGALDQSLEITIDEVECEQTESVGPCYEVGPIGLPLLFPGTVTYEVDSQMRDDGIDVEHLVVMTEGEQHWRPLSDHEVDMQHELVTGSAVYLGVYAVVAVD
ncbi:MAG: hypothetical protein AB1Z98_28705 [Nannocystaceae bacterium]